MPITSTKFKRAGGGYSGFSSPNFNPGTYAARLTDVKEDEMLKYQSQSEYEECVNFVYEFKPNGSELITFERKVKPSTAKKSNLLKDLRALAPGKATPEILGNDESLKALLNSLIGSTVQLLIVPRILDDGRVFPKFEAVLPAQGAPSQQDSSFEGYPDAKQTEAKPTGAPGAMAPAEVPLEDDDPPF